ncbi:uncharacterized protein N7443_008793 [Penicillium atrosanguineum]|uniref:Uncharacterized protein n=1 Tax=Penicillium atrosanguineum TaxID=1132637 RepID=A0A9W9PRA5_9EURO|nr:uncharacterized protein N7443_008793 [Penicillium atrosanguineum]KAJ5125749.1 hypothetical protein N7526_007926 [Penicillium atrosanguineum]KAJ5292840.1 hypothetical protein N7443_008793 [Penicillium atrosanguineum]KAJ5303122.1 hypothetical protein N7476_009921 [Penicillium atrosanguineum]
MAELYDNATGHGPQDIEELPPSVKVYLYKGMDDYCRVISIERDRLYSSFRAAQNARARATDGSCEGRQDDLTEGTQSDHIIFIIEPLTFAHDFLDSRTDPPFHDKLSFNPRTNILVVKMPDPVHEQAALSFHSALILALQPMGLHKAISSWGSSKIIAPDGTTKEADGGWSPRRAPRGSPKRPTVVLEVASSETSAKLRRDAHYWVDPARGQANMAIGVKIHAKNPRITIGQWEWSSQLSRPIQTSDLTITRYDDGIRFHTDQPTPQLVIPFHLLFRRPPVNNRERNIVFAAQELVEFATEVWDMQFENEQE